MSDKNMEKVTVEQQAEAEYRPEESIQENSWRNKSFVIIAKQFAKNKVALVGIIILLILVMTSILAPALAPYDYRSVDPVHAREAPSAAHIFGLDVYGRDILSRILYGGRTSLLIGVGATAFSLVIGIAFGLTAGYFGGKVDNIIMRICDLAQNLPSILLAICISQALGSGLIPLMVALGVSHAANCARLLRAAILNVREQEYIEAAKVTNTSRFKIMFKHILPNSLTPVIVAASMGIGQKIMSAASLSFLGLGISEPVAEWGAMIALGRDYLRYAPHMVLIPGIFVALVVLSFNMVGDGLRDALDPKLRR